jgi:hypothetical protein
VVKVPRSWWRWLVCVWLLRWVVLVLDGGVGPTNGVVEGVGYN